VTIRDTAVITLGLAARAAEMDVPLRMDEDAFRGFYDRTARQVWAYLHRLTGDPHAADDLLQETYYRFLTATAPLDGEAHRRHYLFRIATNLATDRFRRAKTRPTEVVHDSDLVAGGSSADAFDARLQVSQAMRRLRRRERVLIWLAYADGASHAEIAKTLGVRVASVKTLLLRARRRFAALIRHGGAPS